MEGTVETDTAQVSDCKKRLRRTVKQQEQQSVSEEEVLLVDECAGDKRQGKGCQVGRELFSPVYVNMRYSYMASDVASP